MSKICTKGIIGVRGNVDIENVKFNIDIAEHMILTHKDKIYRLSGDENAISICSEMLNSLEDKLGVYLRWLDYANKVNDLEDERRELGRLSADLGVPVYFYREF